MIAGVLCVAALGAAGTAYYLARSTPHQHAVAAAPAPAPVPVVVSNPPTTPPPAKPPGPPHQYVAPAVPTSFTLTGPAFTIKAHVCAMDPVFPLDPPGEQRHTVCWVKKGFGFRPGSQSATSYVLGHSWAEDPLEVLNQASARATREILHAKPHIVDRVPVYPVKSLVGYKLILKTPNGTLTYKVRDAYGARKDQLGFVKKALNQHIRNRVVVITCAELHGVDYEYNVVLDAYLYSSVHRSVA